MKKLFFLPLFMLALCGSTFAQDSNIVGKWAGEFPGRDGKPMPFTMTITDSTYGFDFDGDGKADLGGEYTKDGNQITIWNTSDADDSCPSDQKGVYKFDFADDTLTFTKVTDDCQGRGNEPLVLKRN